MTDKEIVNKFLCHYKRLQKECLTSDQIQDELTKLGYPSEIVSDWAAVNYNYDWLINLLKRK